MKWNFNIVRLLALEQMQIKNNQKYSLSLTAAAALQLEVYNPQIFSIMKYGNPSIKYN